MARSSEVKRDPQGSLSAEQAEELFSTVDETGHTNEETARRQHKLRMERGESVEIDPLAGEDPSGADTDRRITRFAIAFVSTFLLLVMLIQVGWGYVRRVTTTTLAENASMRSVVSALNMGVEWGGGFTQFPSEFTVQEADERTHRIEVTVTDSGSSSELEAFSTAQVQASALSVNALLNPNIDTVVYNVRVRRDEAGRFLKAQLFGFLRPTGSATPFMTFVWTKAASDDGVRFNCSITGVDAVTQARLHDAITSKSTPATIINQVIGGNDAELAENVLSAAGDSEALRDTTTTLQTEADEKRAERALEQDEQAAAAGQAEGAPAPQAIELPQGTNSGGQ